MAELLSNRIVKLADGREAIAGESQSVELPKTKDRIALEVDATSKRDLSAQVQKMNVQQYTQNKAAG